MTINRYFPRTYSISLYPLLSALPRYVPHRLLSCQSVSGAFHGQAFRYPDIGGLVKSIPVPRFLPSAFPQAVLPVHATSWYFRPRFLVDAQKFGTKFSRNRTVYLVFIGAPYQPVKFRRTLLQCIALLISIINFRLFFSRN